MISFCPIPGMIVLREAIKEKKGNELLERLADVWTSFYKNILPMLLAIFYPIQEQGTTIRSVTLVGFRDMVLLKTKIADALEISAGGAGGGITKTSPEIKQMLLVLASVHDSNPPSENYLKLEQLVARVVTPYLGTGGLFKPPQQTINPQSLTKRNSIDQQTKHLGSPRERKLSISQVLKEEVTRKFRRSGSLTGSSNNGQLSSNTSYIPSETNNNPRESSFKRRFKLGDYSTTSPLSTTTQSTRIVVVSPNSATLNNENTATTTTDNSKTMPTPTTTKRDDNDDDMLAYLEERKQRWKSRDEMLGSESLLE